MTYNSIVLKVFLDKKTSRLYVDQRTHAHEIPSSSPRMTLIEWHLEGDAEGGKFLPLEGSTPGFAWDSSDSPAPPAGVFGPAHLNTDQTVLRIADIEPSILGTWSYTLRVNIDGHVYVGEPLDLLVKRGDSNPVIKNK